MAEPSRYLGPDDPITDDALTGGYRVYQRERGHRYSLDDVATAYEAIRAKPEARRCCDLGCGLDSVLLMVAYKLPLARFDAVEAQEVSFELVRRNVERNGQGERIRLFHGDLRDEAVLSRLDAPFDLVTGTPPYMPPGTSTPAPDSQKAHARVELRGGVEDYLASMGRLLGENGRAVVCCDARAPERALRGGEAAGLVPVRMREFVPRDGQKALFTVFVFARRDEHSLPMERAEPFVARTSEGKRSEAYLDLRTFFDLPPHTR